MKFFQLYCISLAIFFAIDLLWLGVIAKDLYKDQLGSLLSHEVHWGPALLFYFLYMAGLVFFAISPALREADWLSSLLYGGFFGLVCYSTYDLTNLATLKGWPMKLVIVDLLWGVFISASTSLITFWIGKGLQKS